MFTDNGILTNHKKNEILPFATTWMDPESILLIETSRTERQILRYHLYVESKKIKQMYVTGQTGNSTQHSVITYMGSESKKERVMCN